MSLTGRIFLFVTVSDNLFSLECPGIPGYSESQIIVYLYRLLSIYEYPCVAFQLFLRSKKQHGSH